MNMNPNPQSKASLSLQSRRNKVMGSSYRLFYKEPLVVNHAKGVWIYDENGDKYLDAYNNVPVIGHSHPLVSELVCKQLEIINTHTRYLDKNQLRYAEKLMALFEYPLEKLIFTCTGSEANDLALQISKNATGNQGVIVTTNGYHGTTASTHAVSPGLSDLLLDDRVEFINISGIDSDAVDAGIELAARTKLAITRLASRGVGVSALLLDSTLTSDGIITHPVGFLQKAIDEVRSVGGLYIADEVQAGFGRAGSWWGFSRHGVKPDLVTLGKPMGNGLPVAALVGRADLLDDYGKKVRYFNTFAGTPVALAAAEAVLQVISDDDLIAKSAYVGDGLRRNIHDILINREIKASVRGDGLMVGVDFSLESNFSTGYIRKRVEWIVNDLRNQGVLVSTTGFNSDVIKIRPPLIFSELESEFLLEKLDSSLRRLSKTI